MSRPAAGAARAGEPVVGDFVVVEQIGGLTFEVSRHPSESAALLAAVDAHVAADEDRELYVDCPGVARPIPVGAYERLQTER